MTKIFKYFIEAFLVYFFFLIGKLLGLKISRILFSNIFLKVAPFFKSKKIINTNLDNFPINLSKDKRLSIISSMWKNYGLTFIEYIFLNYFRKNSSHISIKGEHKLENIMRENKPVIFVSGHFANYELMSMEITKRNIKLATIYRPLNNLFLNPFMEYLRKKYVCENQIKKGLKGVKEVISYIKNNHSIALMIDQRVSEGEKVNFFGKPAYTTTLPAQLSIKFNLSIVPVFIERTSNNSFIIEFYDKIKLSENKDKIEITEKLNKILEKMILSNPYQWIWTHNRWK